MEFQDVVRRRKMVRNYSTDPVDPAVVDLALRNAVRAPNAGFSQGWAFLLLDTPEDVRRFWEATADDIDHPDEWLTGMMKAPVVILPCSSKAAYLDRYAQDDKGWADRDENRWPKPFWDMDTAMAALLMLQTATDHDLGSCFIGIPPAHEGAVRTAFAIPDDFDPVGVVTIGHAADRVGAKGSPSKRARKPMDGLVHRGRWGHGSSPSA
ncbi:MAG: nitroreductase family protein [Actinomycetales bacterium]|nr:MAG: nitroreductase family protein [Actinomycetales bacterium]